MDKAIKNKKVLILFAKIILLGLVVYLFYLQLNKLDLVKLSSIELQHTTLLLTAISLVFANWALEFMKWNATLRFLGYKKSWNIKVRSFLAGILSGFLTPNLLGNFIGRIFYFDVNRRPAIIGITLVSNAAQFLASISFGIISLIFIGFPEGFLIAEGIWIAILGIILLCIAFFYFKIKSLPKFFKRWEWAKSFQEGLGIGYWLRLKFLILSATRHFVFSSQYVLLLIAFGLPFEIELFFLVWQTYFWSTLVPSLWLGKLIIRETIALWIFASFTGELEIVLWCSILLWIINQGVTALVGLPFFKFSTNKS